MGKESEEDYIYIYMYIHIYGEGNGNLLQYSCLENPVDSGSWRAAVHRVAKSQIRLKRLSMHDCIGEGNGNPLQYSCLENPRDTGAWWAAVCGVGHDWSDSAAARIHGGPPCARRSKRFMDGQSSRQICQLAASQSCSFSFLNYDKIYKTKITILNIFKRAIQWH